jgi:hypothetical protein
MGRTAKARHRRQRRERRWVETWLAWATAGYGDGTLGLRHVHLDGGGCLLISTEPERPGGRRRTTGDIE